MRGPRGFWATHDAVENTKREAGMIVLWHTRVVGALPDVEEIEFSP